MSLQTRVIYLKPSEAPEPHKPAGFGFVPWTVMCGLVTQPLFVTNGTAASKYLQDHAIQNVYVAAKEAPLGATDEEEHHIEQETVKESIAINWSGRGVVFLFDENGETDIEEFTTVCAGIAKGGAKLIGASEFDEKSKLDTEAAFTTNILPSFEDPTFVEKHAAFVKKFAALEKHIVENGFDKTYGKIVVDMGKL
jgi:hypothetical protein